MPTTIIQGLKTQLKVGLEIHVELATRTKMWTDAPNIAHPDYFNAAPNTLVDPIVIGMPGTLPAMNRQAVELSIRVGLALGCDIASWCKWDRKSYYYPDLPKNYQISQYDLPLCGEGELDIQLPSDDDANDLVRKTIRIERAHLEEDAGKLLHEAPGGQPIDYSIVDLNRAGTPLLEIVTHPDFETAEEVVTFAQTLRNICRFLGVTEGIMQKGHMRFEPNINVLIEKDGQTYATPIVEIKNLNSYKALQGAITHEHTRQVAQWLEDGRTFGPGSKSTRGWNDQKLVTFLQREKEDAHDYRYFPDPDLIPVVVDNAWRDRIAAEIPELPPQRMARYMAQWQLSALEAQTLTAERDVCLFFEAIVDAGAPPKRAAVLLMNNLAKRANETGCLVCDLGITPQQIAEIEQMVQDNLLSSNGADALLDHCIAAGAEAEVKSLAKAKGLLQSNDEGAIDDWIQQAIEKEPQAADDLRQGKMAAIGRLVGAVMQISNRQANPKVVQQKLRETLLP